MIQMGVHEEIIESILNFFVSFVALWIYLECKWVEFQLLNAIARESNGGQFKINFRKIAINIYFLCHNWIINIRM